MEFSQNDLFLITGASSGIGRQIALKLNENGAKTVIVSRNIEKLKQVKAMAQNPDNVFIEPRDLSQDIDSLPDFISTLREKHGRFRGLAVSHGVVKLSSARLLDKNSMDDIFNINYFSPMLLAKGFLDRKNNNIRGGGGKPSFYRLACGG